jgi:hypothetical protein
MSQNSRKTSSTKKNRRQGTIPFSKRACYLSYSLPCIQRPTPQSRVLLSTATQSSHPKTMEYFSAQWCPPCQQFTPLLAAKYRDIIKSGKQFEIVFVSSDRSQGDADACFKDLPWKALPFRTHTFQFDSENFTTTHMNSNTEDNKASLRRTPLHLDNGRQTKMRG